MDTRPLPLEFYDAFGSRTLLCTLYLHLANLRSLCSGDAPLPDEERARLRGLTDYEVAYEAHALVRGMDEEDRCTFEQCFDAVYNGLTPGPEVAAMRALWTALEPLYSDAARKAKRCKYEVDGEDSADDDAATITTVQ